MTSPRPEPHPKVVEFVGRILHYEGLLRDIVHAWRSIWRRPLSSAAAIATLALGIGLNAASFSVVDWVLVRPLPFPSAHELVRVFSASTDKPSPTALKYSEFDSLSHASTLRTAAAFSTATRVMAAPGVDPAHVVIARVAGDLFGTLGVSPRIGAALSAGAGPREVVLSESIWRSRFAADDRVVGRVVTIDKQPYTVLGVMPAGRGYPADADLWLPLGAAEREDDDRENVMIARLKQGVNSARAGLELATLMRAASPARTAWAEDMQSTEVRGVRKALVALVGSTALLLLMACANVAALLAARGADRAGELAIRGALGASRGRLFRHMLTESVLLALAGGAVGYALGYTTIDLVKAIAPPLPRLAEIGLDTRIVAIGAVATLIVGVIVGLAPSWRASRLDLRAGLDAAGSHRASTHGAGRRMLITVQAAMAVVLTVAAALLGRSLQHLITIDHGFSPDRLVAIDLYLRGSAIGDARQLFRGLIEASQEVAGVQSAAVAMQLPTDLTGIRTHVSVDGAGPEGASSAILRPVTRGYFETIGLRSIDGRGFSIEDHASAPRVAIVNAAFVREVLNGRAAPGVTLKSDALDGVFRVVGVVGDVNPAGQGDRAAMYISLDQVQVGSGSLVVRTKGDPDASVPALVARLRSASPTLALDRIRKVSDVVGSGAAVARFNALLAASFAALALVLAAIGVYGVTAGEVSARWRELAVRLALGGTRAAVLWTIVRPAAFALMMGIGIGVVASVGLGSWTASVFHDMAPADALTLTLVPLLLVAVGVAATSVAGWRVLRADPATTLRAE
jgi:predicted permease